MLCHSIIIIDIQNSKTKNYHFSKAEMKYLRFNSGVMTLHCCFLRVTVPHYQNCSRETGNIFVPFLNGTFNE